MTNIEQEKKAFFDNIEEVADKFAKIYLYGAGNPAEQIYKELERRQIKVEGFVVTNVSQNRKLLFGKEIVAVDCLKEKNEETLFIISTMAQYNDEIYKTLTDRNYTNVIRVPQGNIFITDIEEQRRFHTAIEVTTKIGCAINCRYCPQKLLINQYFINDKKRKSLFDFTDYKKCLENLPQDSIITFSGFVEPFHNPKCADMIRLTADMGFQVSLHTTFDGATVADIMKIKEIPFEYIVLHLPDEEGYANIRMTDEYFRVLDMVLDMKKADGSPVITSANSQGTFNSKVCDFVNNRVKYTNIHLIDRAGSLEDEKIAENVNVTGKIYCPKSPELRRNILLPDGTLVLCCMDFGLRHELGNLLYNTYDEIRNFPENVKLREKMLVENSDIICRHCSIAKRIGDK